MPAPAGIRNSWAIADRHRMWLEAAKTHRNEQPAEVVELPTVIRMIAFLDRLPLVSPQLVRPQIVYQLDLCVSALKWPAKATELVLDFLTTTPSGFFEASIFRLTRPAADGPFEKNCLGSIMFKSEQSLLSDPTCFSTRATFRGPDQFNYGVSVVGHSQLEFRVNGANQPIFSGRFRRLDQHVANQLKLLVERHPAIQDELDNLVPVLDALTCLLGVYAQSAVFKGVSELRESSFQSHVLERLRLILGEGMTEGKRLAGGVTDLCFHDVIIELKVERECGDPAVIASRYSQQPTQYQGALARQIAIVLVLDLTTKERPPGDLRNYIRVVDVPTHGENDGTHWYPSKAFVFVTPGNYRNPSDYSQ